MPYRSYLFHSFPEESVFWICLFRSWLPFCSQSSGLPGFRPFQKFHAVNEPCHSGCHLLHYPSTQSLQAPLCFHMGLWGELTLTSVGIWSSFFSLYLAQVLWHSQYPGDAKESSFLWFHLLFFCWSVCSGEGILRDFSLRTWHYPRETQKSMPLI